MTTAPTKERVRRPNGDFSCRSHEHGFEEVMSYYHVDEAMRYVEQLGYHGSHKIFHGPLRVNARASRDDQSYYDPVTRTLEFGTGDVDDAEDGETILHEFGHAVQDAICSDFGQSDEAAAMGEGFGDYFAASYFAELKRQRHRQLFIPAVMTWDGILSRDRRPPGTPPCLRRVDTSLTYENYKRPAKDLEHENGQIWSATLWEIRRAVGLTIADTVIIESHFQLDGFTTFARGARAILDADRNVLDGAHLRQLTRVFHRRGIGPVE